MPERSLGAQSVASEQILYSTGLLLGCQQGAQSPGRHAESSQGRQSTLVLDSHKLRGE